MFGNKLEIPRPKQYSISSCGDDSFDVRKLATTVEEQKKIIRKLNYKINKLEDALRKAQKSSQANPEPNNHSGSFSAPLELLRQQMEKTEIYQETLISLSNHISQLLNFISKDTKMKPLISKHSATLEPTFKDESSGESSPEQATQLSQGVLESFRQLATLTKFQRQQLNMIRDENQRIRIEVNQIKSTKDHDKSQIQELRQFKLQYEIERKNCIKLRSLLEKTEFQRNNMLTQVHRMSSQEKQLSHNRDELVTLSKSLTCRINHLQNEKDKILSESIRQTEKWSKTYGTFLYKLRQKKNKLSPKKYSE